MGNTVDVIAVIRAMADNEFLISQLYTKYSEKFGPQWEVFWAVLAAEEQVHYNWLSKLIKDVESKTLVLDEVRFDLKAVELFSKYIKELLESAQQAELSIVQAARCAYDIENALIEKKFFEVVSQADAKYMDVVNRLQKATQTHRHKISEALVQIGNQ